MKKYLFTWLFVILGIASAFAQKDSLYQCGTPDLPKSEMEKLPWYGNNQFLYDFLDDLEGSNKRTERDFQGYQVAVQAWVYHKDDGSGTVPENWEIMRWLNMANDIYKLNNIPIKLYLLCDPVHVNRTRYYENIDSNEKFNDIYAERTEIPYLNDPALRNLPAGDYFVQVSACNDCGCNESTFEQIRVVEKDYEECYSIGRGKIQINSMIENEILIYPNPVTNKLNIKLPYTYKENPTQIELYNSIGQLVLSTNYKEINIELPVSSYPKGLYFLKIQNGNELKKEKIIIE